MYHVQNREIQYFQTVPFTRRFEDGPAHCAMLANSIVTFRRNASTSEVDVKWRPEDKPGTPEAEGLHV